MLRFKTSSERRTACQENPGRPPRLAAATALIAVFAVFGAPTAFATARVKPAGVQADALITFGHGRLTVSPANLRSGTNVLFVRNKDTHAHALEIAGPGVRTKHTRVLVAGATATLTMNLHAGSYSLVDTMASGAAQKHRLVVAATSVVPGHVPVVQPPGSDMVCI